jgi:hypothetical protein
LLPPSLEVEIAQTWIKVNLVHAYLLANQVGEARRVYRENRGQQVSDELFELTVLDELDQLHKLGLKAASMPEFEKLRPTARSSE